MVNRLQFELNLISSLNCLSDCTIVQSTVLLKKRDLKPALVVVVVGGGKFTGIAKEYQEYITQDGVYP